MKRNCYLRTINSIGELKQIPDKIQEYFLTFSQNCRISSFHSKLFLTSGRLQPIETKLIINVVNDNNNDDNCNKDFISEAFIESDSTFFTIMKIVK